MQLSPRARQIGMVAVFAAALAARALALLYLGPASDVYYYDTQAAATILQGGSPYGHAYTGIPPPLQTPGAEDVFAYLPFTGLFLVPFYLLGDVRYGAVVADLVIGLCLLRFSGGRGLAAAALYLLVPFTVLLSTVYLNNLLFAMMFVALSALLEVRGWRYLSALAFGVGLATSILVWLLLPFYLFFLARDGRAREALAAPIVGLLLMLPFFAANPATFLYDVLSFQFQKGGVPLLAYGGPFGFSVNPSLSGLAVSLSGVLPPLVLRGLLAAVALVAALIRGRRSRSWLVPATAFLTTALLILPDIFYLAYAEFPCMLLLFLVEMPKRSRPV